MQQLLSFVLLEPLLFFLSLSLLLRLRNALHRFRRGKLLLVLLLHLNLLLLLLLTFNLADHMVHFLRWLLLLGHWWWPILGLLLAFGTLLLLDERLLDRPGFGHTALSGQMRRRSVALIHERVDGQIQPGRGSVRAQWARVPMRRRVSTGVRHLPRVRLVRRAGRLSDGGITRDRPSPRRYRPSSQRASGRQIEFLGDLNSGRNSVRSQRSRIPMGGRVATGVRHLPRVRLVSRAGRLGDGSVARDRPGPRCRRRAFVVTLWSRTSSHHRLQISRSQRRRAGKRAGAAVTAGQTGRCPFWGRHESFGAGGHQRRRRRRKGRHRRHGRHNARPFLW